MGSYTVTNGKYRHICSIDGCTNRYFARGYCRKHWEEFYKGCGEEGKLLYEDRDGNIVSKEEIIEDNKKVCSVDGCNEKSYARGYCRKHYYKYKGKEFTVNTDICSVPFCNETVYCKGLCGLHSRRLDKHGRWWLLNKKVPVCKVKDCKRWAKENGYCVRHSTELKRTGSIVPKLGRDISYKKCKVESCNNTGINKDGYCIYHHRQILKDGYIKRDKVSNETECVEEGCQLPAVASGLCMLHYIRRKRGYKQIRSTDNIRVYENAEHVGDSKVSLICLCDNCKEIAPLGSFYCDKHQGLLDNKDKEFLSKWVREINKFIGYEHYKEN